MTTPDPATPDRRASDQWIRDAQKEQKDGMEALSKKVDGLHDELQEFMEAVLASIPDKNPKKHLLSHEHLEADMAERKAKEENDAKLKLEVRNGLVKTAINAAIMFAGGIMLLGANTWFDNRVEQAQATKVVVEPAKKESK